MKKLFIVFAVIGLVGCIEEKQTSNKTEARLQEELSKNAIQSVGLPAISKFSEKKTLKMILEMRDKEVPTITYIVTMSGDIKKLCNSFGYGIPYATQYTSPQKIADSYSQGGFAILPQADPNGLYSPASADGTWVLCSKNGKVSPVLVEPRIIVSPFDF